MSSENRRKERKSQPHGVTLKEVRLRTTAGLRCLLSHETLSIERVPSIYGNERHRPSRNQGVFTGITGEARATVEEKSGSKVVPHPTSQQGNRVYGENPAVWGIVPALFSRSQMTRIGNPRFFRKMALGRKHLPNKHGSFVAYFT